MPCPYNLRFLRPFDGVYPELGRRAQGMPLRLNDILFGGLRRDVSPRLIRLWRKSPRPLLYELYTTMRGRSRGLGEFPTIRNGDRQLFRRLLCRELAGFCISKKLPVPMTGDRKSSQSPPLIVVTCLI